MFGMGPYEMLVILALGLMLFSPKELPGVLKSIAKFWGSVRRTADEFRDAIMEDEDLRAPLDELRTAYQGTKAELRKAEDAARAELLRARMEVRAAEEKLAEATKETEGALRERVSAGDDAPLGIDDHSDDPPETDLDADAPGDFPIPHAEDSDDSPPAPIPPPPPTGRQGVA